MKKLIALFLVFVMIFAFSGCKKENSGEELPPVEVPKLDAILQNGKIEDTDFALGTLPDAIKQATHYGEAHSDEGIHVPGSELAIDVGEDFTSMSYMSRMYIYENGKEDKGISSVVFYGELYGLATSESTADEVKVAFPEIEFTEIDLAEKGIYFIPYNPTDCSALRYQKDSRRIDFYFGDGVLIAINIVDTNNFTLK